MKVNRVNKNYNNFSAPTKVHREPNFTAKLPKLAQEIKDELPAKGRKMINILDKFEPLRGEAGGIIITAIGTGIVAPIFIAFNPFSKAPKGATKEEKKEHENTKIYTAWRQPISAVLAAIFQLGILKHIDNGLDSLFNRPETAKNLWINLNQSRMNNDKYLKRQAEKEIKKEGLTFKDKAAFKEEVAKRVEIKKNAQLNEVVEEFKQTGVIKLGEQTVENKTVAEILNEQIDRYIEDARKLKIDENGLEYYTRRAKLLMRNEKTLIDILSNTPNEADQVEKYLKEHIEKSDNKEVKALLQEIIDKTPANLRKSKCDRTCSRISKIRKVCQNSFSSINYLQSMLKDNGDLDTLIQGLRSCKIANIDKATPEAIKDSIARARELCTLQTKPGNLHGILENTENFRESAEEVFTKINQDVVKGFRSSVASRYKCINQLAKIVIGMFITVPVTCTALNWTYPRFMDIFFPDLSGKKKAQVKNGGDK